MSQRGFGSIAVTGSLQPAFGCLTGGPIVPTRDQWTNSLEPRATASTASVTVANANLFRQSDRVQIGPTSDFTIQGVNKPDGGLVTSVNYATAVLTVQGLNRAHNASEWCVLALPCGQVSLQANADALTIYEDATTTYPIYKISAGLSQSFGQAVFGNVVETQHVWVDGTSADTFLPYLITI
jgi:hypothetical protein